MTTLKQELQKLKNPEKAKVYLKFFKTKKGEYGEGDTFLGVSVPEQRKIAKKYFDLSLKELQELLSTNIHEYKMCSLFILIDKYRKSDKTEKKKIFDFYLKNTININNWYLVDISAPHIIGDYLLNKDRKILYKLANSKNLWEKRISIISTFTFIKNNQFEDTLKISEILLNDNHDLIHKAVGWMLREVGKRDQKTEETFLEKYHKSMPRTMLRYSIEKFEKNKKKYYLNK